MFFLSFIIFIIQYSEPFKTSMCLQNNEEFSLCGWKCPVTCVNIRLIIRPLKSLCPEKWECHIGCRCAAGYVRDEYSKDCVSLQNCPVFQQLTMKAVLLFVVALASLVLAVPTIRTSIPSYLQDTQRILRDKRSKYGRGYYSYGTASSPIGSYTPYPWSLPYQNYVNPYAYGYQAIYSNCGRGYYRAEDQDDREIMSYSDKESEQPLVRKTNDATATTSNPQLASLSEAMPSIGQLLTPSGTPGYGIYPNGPSTGCNVPLYFSCTPSIVPGRLVRAPSSLGYGYSPFGYRGSEGMWDKPYEHLSDEQIHDNVAKTGRGQEEANDEANAHQ